MVSQGNETICGRKQPIAEYGSKKMLPLMGISVTILLRLSDNRFDNKF